MSRYRWLRFTHCIEAMQQFPALNCKADDELRKLLVDAVSCGSVRSMFNDEIVPKAHIGTYINLYASATPAQDANTLPPDLALSYDDVCAVFDRATIDNRKRGRPAKEHAGWPEDRKLAFEMHKMLAGNPNVRSASSAAEAARMLVRDGRVSGAGTPENRAKRLERTFRKHYSS